MAADEMISVLILGNYVKKITKFIDLFEMSDEIMHVTVFWENWYKIFKHEDKYEFISYVAFSGWDSTNDENCVDHEPLDQFEDDTLDGLIQKIINSPMKKELLKRYKEGQRNKDNIEVGAGKAIWDYIIEQVTKTSLG